MTAFKHRIHNTPRPNITVKKANHVPRYRRRLSRNEEFRLRSRIRSFLMFFYISTREAARFLAFTAAAVTGLWLSEKAWPLESPMDFWSRLVPIGMAFGMKFSLLHFLFSRRKTGKNGAHSPLHVSAA